MWGGYRYSHFGTRFLAQLSLRCLGERPRGYPVVSFIGSDDRNPFRPAQPGPVDGPTRHANLARVRRGMPVVEVYQLLGAPDEMGGWRDTFWRYEVDAEPSYTALLWLEEDSVARIVKYLPPFWVGPEQFPARERSLLGSDGRTGVFRTELDGEAFVGTRVEVDVLQELASSGRDPVGPLAQAVLDGRYDALPPLADALEEADDPLTSQVRSWFKL